MLRSIYCHCFTGCSESDDIDTLLIKYGLCLQFAPLTGFMDGERDVTAHRVAATLQNTLLRMYGYMQSGA